MLQVIFSAISVRENTYLLWHTENGFIVRKKETSEAWQKEFKNDVIIVPTAERQLTDVR